jgi:hypothetical protein
MYGQDTSAKRKARGRANSWRLKLSSREQTPLCFEGSPESAWDILDNFLQPGTAKSITIGNLQDDLRDLVAGLSQHQKRQKKEEKKSMGFWAKLSGLFGKM